LGYKSSGSTTYGGYFTSSTTGSGKSAQANIGIGIGAWGDLMGADIHGKVYGIYAEGENYALYTNGPVIKNDLDIHLQTTSTNTNTVLYTNVSTDATVQTFGVAQLVDGKVTVAFDQAFTSSVSTESPVIITVTPTGKSYGVYISEVSHSGFSILENNEGKSNTQVNFIAIGKRSGYEHPVLPQEVLDAGYTQKLSQGLNNDADTQTNGEGLYYANGQLIVGVHPSQLPDPNRPAEDPYKPVPGKPETAGKINPASPTGMGDFIPTKPVEQTKPLEASPEYGGVKSNPPVANPAIPTTVGSGTGKIEPQTAKPQKAIGPRGSSAISNSEEKQVQENKNR